MLKSLYDENIILSVAKNLAFGNTAIDFIDAWIVAFASAAGVRAIYTFDRKHFKGIDGIDMMHP